MARSAGVRLPAPTRLLAVPRRALPPKERGHARAAHPAASTKATLPPTSARRRSEVEGVDGVGPHGVDRQRLALNQVLQQPVHRDLPARRARDLHPAARASRTHAQRDMRGGERQIDR
jgi:hypothetical protein